ncbi:MAG: NAD-dependent epimerase/dehydratase family protein [Nitriliruptor sp.]|nr:MAG: NAD-dependent epimerase/dehydratase family protein [Nitriliruptor sp.]
MNLLIAGCGDLGTELGLRALAAGHRVHGLRRRAEVLPDGFHRIAADLGADLPPLPADTEVVVFTTAADRRDVDAYRRAYVTATGRVLDALEAAGAAPRRVLFTSSTAVYGVDDGSEVDEDTPTGPTSATGAVLVEAERALWQRRPDAVSLRLAGVYGPGRTRLVDQVRDGRALRPEREVHTNRIHRDDAAAALLHLAGLPSSPATCYLGVDDEPAPLGEVLAFLAAELGLPPPPVGEVRRSRGGDKRCRNARLRATGLELTYPTYREGYRAVLAGEGTRHP